MRFMIDSKGAKVLKSSQESYLSKSKEIVFLKASLLIQPSD